MLEGYTHVKELDELKWGRYIRWRVNEKEPWHRGGNVVGVQFHATTGILLLLGMRCRKPFHIAWTADLQVVQKRSPEDQMISSLFKTIDKQEQEQGKQEQEQGKQEQKKNKNK